MAVVGRVLVITAALALAAAAPLDSEEFVDFADDSSKLSSISMKKHFNYHKEQSVDPDRRT